MGLIRFCLALAVILAHTSPLFSSHSRRGPQVGGFRMMGGDAAVQTFYIISGFYMALVLNEKYLPGKTSRQGAGKGAGGSAASAYGLFMGNRLLRLFPGYLAVILLSLLLYGARSLKQHKAVDVLGQWAQFGPHMGLGAMAFLIGANLLIFGQDLILFMGLDRHGSLFFTPYGWRERGVRVQSFLVVPQAWSIAVELWFYLVAPFLVRRRWPVIMGLILASLGVRWAVYRRLGTYQDPWTYRFFPSELALFLTGTLCYKVYRTLYPRQGPSSERRRPNPRLGTAVLLIALVATLAYAYIELPGKVSSFKLPAYYLLMAASFPFLFAFTQSSAIDRFIGDLSYPMYITHMLCIRFLTPRGSPRSWQAALLTVILSAGLLLLVDRPVDRLRQRWVKARSKRAAMPEVVDELAATPQAALAGTGLVPPM
jgi:peptidoglycan/LPS O-acetylase OafA/YrhL